MIWRVSDSPLINNALSVSEQSAVQQYVQGGGSFLMSSMEQLSRVSPSFMTNVLQVSAFGVDATAEGALVQEVADGSAAEKAGIEVGDVIVSVDGQRIKGASDLRNAIGLKRSGDSVRVDIIRDGKRRQLSAMLSEVSSTARIGGEDIHPGLAGAELANHEGKADQFAGPGVRIESVEPDSPAAHVPRRLCGSTRS